MPLFFSGHDFLPDGSAMLCSMSGDVWHVSGLDNDLQNIRWRRFASGLHQAQGLVIAKGQVYVLGRDQITRLHDRNSDGEADFYECFSNKMQTSPSAHDFICGLERDVQGRFYAASSKQGLLRFSHDGQNVEVLATGFRNPDGLGLCTDGSVTVPCSEGDWTPASMICLVKPQSATATTPHFGLGGPRDGKLPALPLVYLPRGMDNSSGGQIAIPDNRWGPLQGNMVHFSFGQGTHFLLLQDEVSGQTQGAVVPLVGDFLSGVHRGRFHPRDGQLYVSGMAGWGTYTTEDSCLQRVRYTNDPVQLPRSFHIHQNGVLISFTQPVDSKSIADLSKQFAQAWNYRYSGAYGSPELAPCHGNAVGHEALRIASVHPIDTNSIFVELPDLQPVNQLHLLLQIDNGRAQELFLTVHKLDAPFTQIPNYQPTNKIIAAHPLEVDVTLLGKTIPNPWRDKLADARLLEIAAGNNLTYATRTLNAKAGENLKLTFTNPDTVPHNWVLVKPGTLQQIGALTNSLVADPEAFLRQYVPQSDDVICYTDIVRGGKKFTIHFQAPQEPGRYPYLCTFPGHWMVMNGELIVE
jgi:azurin